MSVRRRGRREAPPASHPLPCRALVCRRDECKRGDPSPGKQAPTNNALPTISGTAQSGSTLTASTGSWDGVSLSYTFQWLRCDAGGDRLHSHGGSDAPDVPRDISGRWFECSRGRYGDEQERCGRRDLCGAEDLQPHDHVAPSRDFDHSRKHRSAVAQRRAGSGSDTLDDFGQLVGQSHQLRVPVEALRSRRSELHLDCRGDRSGLRPDEFRCRRLHPPRPLSGAEFSRQRNSDIGIECGRYGARACPCPCSGSCTELDAGPLALGSRPGETSRISVRPTSHATSTAQRPHTRAGFGLTSTGR